MAGNRGLYILPDGSSNGTTPLNARLANAGLIADDGTSGLAARNGVFYDGQGNVVSGNTDTGTMSYSVRACQMALYLLGVSSSGIVTAVNDAVFKATTTAAPGSNSRIDVIWVRQHAVASDGGPDTDTILQIGVTQGTAAALPTVPAIPTGAMALAQALMPSGTTSTNGLTITQVHNWTSTHGSPIPVRNQTERDSTLTGFNGLSVYRLDNQLIETHNGTAWGGAHKPRRLLTRLATFSLATATNTAVGSWTADTGDDGDGVITFTNPVLTINRAGRYRVRFLMIFPTNTTGSRTVAIYRNPTIAGGVVTAGTASAINTIAGQATSNSLDVEVDVVCAAGDTLAAACSQTSGGALTCGSTTQGFVLWQVILDDPS